MAGMAQERIRNTETITPSQVATRVVREDAFAWFVACEGECHRQIAVAKKEYIPLDPYNPHGQVDCRVLTAPGARRCAACGPFPGSPAEAALQSQRKI